MSHDDHHDDGEVVICSSRGGGPHGGGVLSLCDRSADCQVHARLVAYGSSMTHENSTTWRLHGGRHDGGVGVTCSFRDDGLHDGGCLSSCGRNVDYLVLEIGMICERLMTLKSLKTGKNSTTLKFVLALESSQTSENLMAFELHLVYTAQIGRQSGQVSKSVS